MTKDEEKANIPNAFFAPIKEQSHRYPVPELEDRDEEEKETTIIQRKQLLHHLNIFKSMEPYGIHPRVLRELGEVLMSPFPAVISSQGQPGRSWVTGSWEM